MSTSIAPRGAVHLDHVGFIVQDLDASSTFMEKLGFSLTARADHTRSGEDGALVSTGSSQRSIMLQSGYIELMQITDPGAGHQLASAPTVRFGLHIVAFGTGDADACHAQCLANGVQAGPVLHWARPVTEAGAQGLARFAYFGARWTAHDASYLCWVQHLTPELMRPAGSLQHSNQAAGVAGIRYRGPGPQVGAWTARLLAAGATLMRDDADGAKLDLHNACVQVDADAAMAALLPSALAMDFADCAGLRKRCADMGVPLRELEGGVLELDLRPQLGLYWICRPPIATSQGESHGIA